MGEINKDALQPQPKVSPKVNIDGTEYDTADLSAAANDLIMNIRVVDMKMTALRQELAIMQTAKNAYSQALKAQLPGSVDAASADKPIDPSSISFMGSD